MVGARAFGARLKNWLAYRKFLKCCMARNSDLSKSLINLQKFENLQIGQNVVTNDAFLDTNGPIRIDDYVFFGWGVKVLTGSHDYTQLYDRRMRAIEPRGVIIEEGVWVASFAIILPGTIIGRHAVVGAGSVVHGRVEPFTLVAGNPAIQISHIVTAENIME